MTKPKRGGLFMKYTSKMGAECYYPPILSNGELVLAPTAEGTLDYTKEKDFPNFKKAYDGVIYREGRRAIEWLPNFDAVLIPFGSFSFKRGAELVAFEQELCVDEGCVRSECEYSDGARVYSECIVCQDKSVYVLRKRFEATAHEAEINYSLLRKGSPAEHLVSVTGTQILHNGVIIDFFLKGCERTSGQVAVFCDSDVQASVSGGYVTLKCKIPENGELSFFVCIEDSLGTPEYAERIQEWMKELLAQGGVDSQFKKCAQTFQRFYEEGYVRTPDQRLNSIYKTALYNLRCYATKWSMAVGIYEDSWQGKFFTFDEYYNFIAMLESGRYGIARRVPEFRMKTTLNKAIKRATHLTDEQAHFPFITDEYGNNVETNGFWRDHIFQNATVTLGTYEYYEYTGDMEYLRRCYRMIRACAKFFTLHMIYQKEDGSYFVGKCTDLERLGSSVENAFFTACGVIKTLEICAKAAEILGEDGEYRAECLRVSEGLRKNLPTEDGRYVPFLGCRQKSIAVFGGKFPFDVIAEDDDKLIKAWEDFEENGGKYGNMYAVGKKLSSWYALWKSIGYVRVRDTAKAYKCLCQSYESVGCFDEMFEINEEQCRYRPYFSTAAAVFVNVANEMMLQSDGENIYLLPAFEDGGEKVEFKLLAKGGALVEARIDAGKLQELKISSICGATKREFNVYFKGEFYKRVKCGEGI